MPEDEMAGKSEGPQGGPAGGGPRPRRGMLAFYVATGVAVVLFVGAWQSWPRLSVWYVERQTMKAFLGALDKPVSVDLTDRPAEEGLQYLLGVLDVGCMVERTGPATGESKITLQMRDVPVAAVLESWCAQVGADWIVVDANGNMTGAPVLKLYIGDPERARRLEQISPMAARMSREYRDRIRANIQVREGGAK